MTPTPLEALRHITTGTICTMLLKKGIRHSVVSGGVEHELMESFIVSEVEKGARLPGLYPMNDETKTRFAAWKKQRL